MAEKKVHEYFVLQKRHGGPILPLQKVRFVHLIGFSFICLVILNVNCNFNSKLSEHCREKRAAAMGISKASVSKYLSSPLNDNLDTPGKTRRPKPRPMKDVDSFTLDAIRYLIYELHRKRECSLNL